MVQDSLWLKGGDTAGQFATTDESVDFICALVSMHGLGVHQLLHDMVVEDDSVAATDFSCEAGDLTAEVGAAGLYSTNLADGRAALVHGNADENQIREHHFA